MQALARSLVVSVLVTAPALVAAQPLTFAKTDYPSGLGARAVVTGDFNRDGWPDVAHAGLATSHLSILLNTPGEGFAPRKRADRHRCLRPDRDLIPKIFTYVLYPPPGLTA